MIRLTIVASILAAGLFPANGSVEQTAHGTAPALPPTGAPNVMRWEDDTQTAMDPSDDCTIWYVGDYVKKDAATYSTRTGSFRFLGCSR